MHLWLNQFNGKCVASNCFPGNADIATSGIILSLGGVGIPVSSFGVLVAMYFGDNKEGANLASALKTFIQSPIILSFVLGLFWAYFSFPVSGPILAVIFGALKFISLSLTFLVALLTGLTIKPLSKADLSWPLIFCVILALIVEPMLAYEIDLHVGDQNISSVLLVLLGAMPSSPLAIALSLRYGCDVGLSSKLVVGTCIICAITLPVITYFYR